MPRAAFDPAPRRPLSRGERWGVLLFSLGLLGLVAAELLSDFTPRKLSVLLIAGFWGPLLVVHELGHALCARAVGFRVHEIVLGFGPELARFRMLGANVTLRLIPVEGYVVPSPSSLRGARAKSALVYFGGPGAEILCALALLLLMGPERMFTRSDELSVIAGQSCALSALIGVAMTLIPHRGGGSASDGLGILLSFRLSDDDFAYRMARPAMDEAQRRIDGDDAKGALAVVEAAMQRDAGNPYLPIMRVRCLAALGEHAGAFAELERMQQEPAGSDLVEAERLHAAACVVLEAGRRDLLQDAEGACREALARVPGFPDVELTLAAVLIERERYREAEQLAQGVYRATREPGLEDRCLALLARTAYALGREDDAARFREAFEQRHTGRRLRRQLAEGAPRRA